MARRGHPGRGAAARRARPRPRGRHRHVEPAVRRRRCRGRPVRLLARDAPGRQGHRPHLPFTAGDGTRLPFADDTFDAVTISFGLRNIVDPVAGLREMLRVTRPGGRLVVCGFSHPTWAPLRTLYVEYLMKALPPIARAVSSSPDAYVYLAESIRAWPDQAALAEVTAVAGWQSPSRATCPAASSRCTAPAPERRPRPLRASTFAECAGERLVSWPRPRGAGPEDEFLQLVAPVGEGIHKSQSSWRRSRYGRPAASSEGKDSMQAARSSSPSRRSPQHYTLLSLLMSSIVEPHHYNRIILDSYSPASADPPAHRAAEHFSR